MHKAFTALSVAVIGSLTAFSGVWVTDLDKGMEIARSDHKKVLIYFHTDTCPYCLQMEEFVLGDPEVDRYIGERFVVVSLSLKENRDVARRFGAVGVPYFVSTTPNPER
ncbi:MAG: thioredoxin family protein [Aquificota bacterium]|nr:thioredoxin family protein [Aquificota bacterium]